MRSGQRLVAGIALALAAGSAHAGSPDDPLVDITALDPTFVLDLRYATPDNFLKRRVYDRAVALLRKPVAERLARVQKRLAAKRLRLKIWDAYRPHSVQKEMWKIVPDERYVANPAKGSSHGRGAAVDVTLVDAQGNELDMGTAHDDFSPKAAPWSKAVSAAVRANRKILIDAMGTEGFLVVDTEWWHFSSPADDKLYKVLDVPLRPAAPPSPSPR
jgi:D-alanyl-D-alanine dipeptidase